MSKNKPTYEELAKRVKELEEVKTGRKQAEEALRESEEKYRTLFETMTLGVVYQDADGRIISANPASERIMGLTHDQMMGRTSMNSRWKSIHEDGSDFPGERHPSMVALKTGKEALNTVMGIFHPLDEKYHWLNINAVPQFRPGEDKPYQVYTTFEDITERKRADEALRESEENLRMAQRLSNIGSWKWIMATDTVQWSEELCHINGHDPKLPVPSFAEMASFYTPESWKRLNEVVTKAIHNGESYELDLDLVRTDGIIRNTIAQGEVDYDNSGKIVSLHGTIQDITGRKQAEEALRESEKKYRTLFETMIQGIVYQDADGRIFDANPASERIMGLTHDQMMGRTSMDSRWKSIHEDGSDFPGETHPSIVALKTGKEVTNTVMGVFHHLDEKYYWINIHAIPQFRPGEDKPYQVYTTFDDITESKQAEEEIKNLAKFPSENPNPVLRIDLKGRLIYCNKASDLLLNTFNFRSGDLLPEFMCRLNDEVISSLENKECEIECGERIFSFIYAPEIALGYVNLYGRDITERKRAAEALKEYIRLNKILLDNFPSVILLLRPYTREIVISNEEAVKVGAVPGTRCFSTWGQREEPCPWCLAPAVWATGQAQHLEVEAGGIVWDAHWIPVDDDLYMHYAFDITERKRMEDVLREREENTRYIIKHDPNAIAVYDRNLHYIAVSDRYLKDYNVKEEDIIGKHHYEVFPEMPQRWKDVHQRCLAGAIERNDDDYFERPDGSITYNRWECRPWYRADGEIGGMITYTEVTTERKKAEIALRESEERFRRFSDSTFEGILIHDNGKIIDTNKSFAKIYGYEQIELIGMDALKLVAPESLEQVRINIVNESEQPYEAVGLRKDGSTFLMEINARNFEMKGQRLRMAAVRDISSYKEAVEELRKSHNELHKLTAHIQELREEERKRIAHEIHDDLGQTLTALKIDISLLKETIPEKENSLLQKIESISKLVTDSLTTLKRISSELRPDILDHLGLIEAIRWYLSEFRNRTRIKCRLSLLHEELDLDQKVSANIYRLVQESLTNVIRHANATEVKLSLRKKKGALELKIKDNGAGITRKHIESSDSFGLLGMRERSTFCGGKIEIKGLPNQGTTVTVTIPMAERK